MVCASCLTRTGRIGEVLAWENILCAIFGYIQSAAVLKCMIMCCEKKVHGWQHSQLIYWLNWQIVRQQQI